MALGGRWPPIRALETIGRLAVQPTAAADSVLSHDGRNYGDKAGRPGEERHLSMIKQK